MRREPSLTFRGALRILGRTETPLIDKLDALLGGTILAAGVGVGIAAAGGPPEAAILAPVWQWVDQKNEAGGILRKLVGRFSSRINGAAGLERRNLIAAAHSTIVVAAYFEVFHEAIADAGFGGLKLSAKEKQKIALEHTPHQATSLIERLYASEIPAPSATRGHAETVDRVGEWINDLHKATTNFIGALDLLGLVERQMRPLARQATERYRTFYIDLATSVPEFKVWSDLDEHAATRKTVETSFDQVRALLTALGGMAKHTPAAAQVLDRANTGRLRDPVVSTSVPWPDARFRFPNVGELFVPPGFRICVYESTTRASDDAWWAELPLQHHLADRLAAHVLSTQAMQVPLLLLGHPGAGKSMLTKVLAASLPSAEYATVSIPLRAVSAHASILDQIQEGLDLATNRRLTWAQLVEETADRVRVVLLDGLDELLLAANLDRTGYLQEIARFQEVEADQDRPVAIIVTSRTVVADRVDIPPGTPILKIAAFDDDQIGHWISRWDIATPHLATAPRTRRLSRDEALRQPHLARQPLLLMLLALYVSSPGAPGLGAVSSQATLYTQLFTRFAGRETTKELRRTLLRDEAKAAIDASIDRLSIAAFAMFNRGRQHVGTTELGHDIEALFDSLDDRRPKETGQRLLTEFFFIHASEATLIGGDAAERSYEFLHATFGEYLVARKIIEVLRDMADVAYNGRKRRDADDDLLYALLSHQALATQRPILQFANQLFRSLPPLESAQITEVLEVLIGRWRNQSASERYRSYRPMPFDQLRQLAAYSANLLVLRLHLTTDGRLTRSTQLAEDWPALVTLWNAGLDADAWLAMLGTMTLDRRDGTICSKPPSRGHNFPELDSIRLLGNIRIANQLGLGASILHGARDVFSADDWRLMMQSWLIPAIVFGEWDRIVGTPPPPGTTEADRREIAGLLSCLLRLRVSSLRISEAKAIVELLLRLDGAPEPFTLAIVICKHPKLLAYIPALANAKLYRGNPAIALMLYGATERIFSGDDPRSTHGDEPRFIPGSDPAEWRNLYRAIGSAAGAQPDRRRIEAQEAGLLMLQSVPGIDFYRR